MDSHSTRFNVVVIGAGPAGIAAACAVAETGQSVAVLDQSPWLGGQIWRGAISKRDVPLAAQWIERLRRSSVEIFSRASVFAAPVPRSLQAERPAGVLEIRWDRLILATGARELFLPFPGWTLPGVVGPGGLQAMVKGGWPVEGKRVVVAGSGPLLLAAADGLRQHGAHILVIAEQAPLTSVSRFGAGLWRYPGKLIQASQVKARLLGIPYRCGCWPVRAEGADTVQRVVLTNGHRTWTHECDYLACGFHLVPNLELPSLLGCELEDGFVKVNASQETTVADVFCAGEPTGIAGVESALVEGELAGYAAAGFREPIPALQAKRARWHRFRDALKCAFVLRAELRRLAAPETIVCRCEDVRHELLAGHRDWRAAKLHTRCGMGPCQGRVCGAATQFLFGWNTAAVRPPILPVSLGALVSPATTCYDPERTQAKE